MSDHMENNKDFSGMEHRESTCLVKGMKTIMDLSDIVKIRNLMASAREGGARKMAMMAVVFGVAAALIPGGHVNARTLLATVQGTVSKGTTSDTLKLYSSSSGNYVIKIDNDTDTSRCKMLIPGKAVTVGIYRGDDANLHADSIVSGKVNANVSIDSNRSTVTGKVMEATTEDMLYLDTSSGEMHIKLDTTTDYSGVKIMTVGKEIAVVTSRGSDAYMHAISIADNSGTGSSSGTSTSSTSSSSAPANTTEVKGTPTDKSTSNVLYLNTDGGVMYLVIDSDTDTSGGFMFTPGNKVTAYVYRGSDANMHAAKVVGTRSSGATVGSTTTTFSGSVESNSNEGMLYLNTSGGTMKFKLDSTTSLNNAKGLTKGKIVTVSGSVGSDEYWHAVTITTK